MSLKYAIDEDLAREAGTITQGDVTIGKSLARTFTGGFPDPEEGRETKVLNLKLNAPDMSVDELEAMLPALGVVLPSGSKLKGGTLSADLAISGPLANLVISGPVRMSNTKLIGFDTGAKLGALSAFSGKAPSNPDTVIQSASSNVRVAPDGTRADAINVTIPSIAVVTGAGTISPSGVLNFQMMADPQGNPWVRKHAPRRAVLGGGDKGGVPFKIEGTTSDPKFVPDIGGMAADAAKEVIQKSVSQTTGGKAGLGGILGKKPK